MDLRETATPVLYALHEDFSERPKLTEDKFLNIIHAFETFHRRTRNNEDRPKAIHKRSVKAIVESCPEEHKVGLKENSVIQMNLL